MSPGVVVLVENTYCCGRRSEQRHTVRAPGTGEDVEDWWDDAVAPLTGDGHRCAATEEALYEATVVAAPGRPDLVGRTVAWAG